MMQTFMKTRQLILSTLAVALLAVMPAVAQADPVTFTLPASVSVTPGGSVTVLGTISNGGAPDFNLTSISVNFSDPLLTYDATAFLTNAPLVLGALESYGPAAFFDVIADAALAPGTYLGTATVFDSDQRFVTTTFQVQVQAANVPEPVSIALLGSGLGGLYLARRRKRKAEGKS
jgi:hypothetical protein